MGEPVNTAIQSQAAAPMSDIHDIKAVLAVGPDLTWLWWGVAAVAALMAALWVWWMYQRKRRRGLQAPAAPQLSPEAEAFAGLDALEGQRDVGDKQFYFRLSAILRLYVERRFGIPAAEMTIEELLPRMADLPLEQDMRYGFKRFCETTEPIKFAGVPADRSRRPVDLNFGRLFVQRTTPQNMPQTTPTENGLSGPAPRQNVSI